MQIFINPIYQKYFDPKREPADWNGFVTPDKDQVGRASKQIPDFIIRSAPKSWRQTGKSIFILTLKVFVFPIAICEIGKYVIQRITMTFLYPAQSRLFKYALNFFGQPAFTPAGLDLIRQKKLKDFKEIGLVARRIVINHNGTFYDGVMVGKSEGLRNGNWILQATGNCEPIEHSIDYIYNQYNVSNPLEYNPNPREDFNLMMMNGPSVGRSEGQASPKTMGEVQEAGLQFLETAVKAKKIVMAGRSLGGMAISEAVLKHQFKENVKYYGVFQMTFAYANDIAAKTVGLRIVDWLCRKSGIHSNTPAACLKLAERGSDVVIFQATKKDTINPQTDDFITDGPFQNPILNPEEEGDGPILKEASLGYVLRKKNISHEKIQYRGLKKADHMTSDVFSRDLIDQFAKD